MSIELSFEIDDKVKLKKSGETGIIIAINGYGSVRELQTLYHIQVQLDSTGEKIKVQPDEIEQRE